MEAANGGHDVVPGDLIAAAQLRTTVYCQLQLTKRSICIVYESIAKQITHGKPVQYFSAPPCAEKDKKNSREWPRDSILKINAFTLVNF
jgi:hypothetical protein